MSICCNRWAKRGKRHLRGIKCIKLNEQTVKILEIHFSYNKKFEEEKSFNNYIAKIEKVLKTWRMRDVTIEGNIVLFKLLDISKTLHLALIKFVPTFTKEQLNMLKKNFIWQGKKE